MIEPFALACWNNSQLGSLSDVPLNVSFKSSAMAWDSPELSSVNSPPVASPLTNMSYVPSPVFVAVASTVLIFLSAVVTTTGLIVTWLSSTTS